MFRHRGKARTFNHNLRLAAFLSFTAGIVNISGLLSLGVLTTNVTGHFAYFSEAIQKHHFIYAFSFLFYIISFLAGAFFSSLLTEFFIGRASATPHNAAIFVETGLLLLIGVCGDSFIKTSFQIESIACLLLFSMGLQNSLVTSISNATVRTTHLTGLFTDLGIELSQLFFYKEANQNHRLKKSIGLRCSIIAFFFLGCVIGGFVFQTFKLRTLILASIVLILSLLYDNLRISTYKIFKKVRTAHFRIDPE
jgi:uncharacterized membrane protein YoaK (UPF0700 family)